MEKKSQEELKLSVSEKLEALEEKRIKLQNTHGREVSMQYVLDKEEQSVDLKSDKIIHAFFLRPIPFNAVKALDLVIQQKYYEAGMIIWDSVFMESESSPEVSTDESIMLGMYPRVGMSIKATVPEIKKN